MLPSLKSSTTTRFVWLPALCVGVWLCIGYVSRSKAAPLQDITPPRPFTFTYRARVKPLPPDAKRLHLWVPLVKTQEGQEVLKRIVHTRLAHAITEDPEYRNEMLHAAFTPDGHTPIDVQVDYVVRLYPGGGESRPASAEELQRSLQAHQLVIIDDEVRARAHHAIAGRTTLKSRARGMYDDVIRRMVYDKTAPGWGRGDTRRACRLGKGNCTDFHSLFISMARAERIPARFKIGWLIPQGASGEMPGYHCWAEFYDPDQGWVPVDASEAWKHPALAERYFGGRDADRILLSVGRDIQLNPPQAGERVNIFFFPYLEIDGQVSPEVETTCWFGQGA